MTVVPELDTVAFDELVEEGRSLIPRFAPEWTDHNLHDPGMTLLDLLAWFVDQQVYRIGFVGDRHLAAFAALLGVRPRGAVPARGLIWPADGERAAVGRLEALSRVHPFEQPDISFAVAHEMLVTGSRIARLEAVRPAGRRRIHVGDDGAILLDPDTLSLQLTLQPPLAGPGWASVGLAYEGPLPEGGAAPGRLDCGIEGGPWQRAEPSWHSGGNGSAGASGALLFALPADARVDRLRLDPGAGLPRRLLPVRVALDVIPVAQVERLPALKFGEGTGWPDQERRFDLAGGALVAEGEGFPHPQVRSTARTGESTQWRAVPDFAASGPGDPVYVLDPATGTVRFGNGVNGRAPAQGEEMFRGPLDVTLGDAGNVAAGAEWSVVHLDTGGASFGRNLEPLAGGSDSWSSDDILDALSRAARLRRALLTDAELVAAALALRGYGVAGAEALPRFLPALPRHEVPGARTLLLRPAAGVEATDAWLNAVASALAPSRVIGERLAVIAAEPVAVDIDAVLLVAPGLNRAVIDADARQRVGDRLAAAKGRQGPAIEPWPSGRPVTVAEIESLLASVEGVASVLAVRLARAGDETALVSIPLERTEIAVASRVSIRFETGGR